MYTNHLHRPSSNPPLNGRSFKLHIRRPLLRPVVICVHSGRTMEVRIVLNISESILIGMLPVIQRHSRAAERHLSLVNDLLQALAKKGQLKLVDLFIGRSLFLGLPEQVVVSELAQTLVPLQHQAQKDHVPEPQELLILEMGVALLDHLCKN